jgi:competence protein ComFC
MKKRFKFDKKILNLIMDLIYPPKCIFCTKLLKSNTKIEICQECYKKIPFITRYSDYIERFLKSSDVDLICFDKIICICEYKGIIKESIIRFKYFGRASYYRTFAIIIANNFKKITDIHGFDIIIGVPLHKRRERNRGYNQASLISKELGRILNIPDKSRLLIRDKYTKTQSLLHKNERYFNVKDAFRVTNENEVKDRSILLIDDVLTTGYTLNECSKVLKKAGAKKVYAVVIAAVLHSY